MKFDPNQAADPNAGIFGLPFSEEDSKLIFIPVPWEATTSYGAGTSLGPQAMLRASHQLDLFDHEVEKPYEAGMHMLPEEPKLHQWNEEAKILAQTIIDVGGDIAGNSVLGKNLARVNELSKKVNQWVEDKCVAVMKKNKIAVVVGGDHACPLGAFRAAAQMHGDFGLLHFDAHLDMRNAFEGFENSHASIMRNALDEVSQIKKCVQVGIRDYCEEEFEYVQAQKNRVEVFYDSDLKYAKYKGEAWNATCERIIAELPKKVWISFDIDGLDPRYCPHTGTPVAGGLEFQEATYLIRKIVESGRTIIGFDLCEVSPPPEFSVNSEDDDKQADEWDANVGMRMLYKLAGYTFASQKIAKLR